jgi:hypothetical protein
VVLNTLANSSSSLFFLYLPHGHLKLHLGVLHLIKGFVAMAGKLLWVLRADQVFLTVFVRFLVTGITVVLVLCGYLVLLVNT